MPSQTATAARLIRAVTAAVFVILTSLFALGTPLAEAQTGGPQFNRNPAVLESDGEVVLTLSISWARPARVRYQTFDGEAKAPGDYTSVSGEAVFAGGYSRQIKIPIIDDDFADGDETFTVRAWEEPEDGWPGGVATVRIIDDDSAVGTGQSAAATSTTSESVGARTPTEPRTAVDPAATTTTTTTATPPPPEELALPDGEFRPGPGFELTSEGVPEPAPQRRGGAGGSASGLAIGSGTAALGVGALAVVRRRRRWSSTQA